MKLCLREETNVAAPPEGVWRVLVDTSRRPEWNPKVQDLARTASGPTRVGERYRFVYRLRREQHEIEAETVACEAPRVLSVRERTPTDPPDRAVIVTWHLEADGDGTRITQLADISRGPMSLPTKVMLWLIARLGSPRRPTAVERLAALAGTEPERGA